MRDNELGSYLRLLRIKNNLTMTQTADKTGITQGYISQIENGIYSPSAKTLARLARTYSVPEIHLLRKAGIVQLSGSSGTDANLNTTIDIDPLIEVSSTAEIIEMIKRGLASLEYLGDQLRLRGQLANLPVAVPAEATREDLGAQMTLPLYDAGWHPLRNATGEQTGLPVPAYMCNDDADAFVLVAADEAMTPQVNHGDWVVVSPATAPESGRMVAINDRNQIKLRMFNTAGDIVSLQPLNPSPTNHGLLFDRNREHPEIIGQALRVVNRTL